MKEQKQIEKLIKKLQAGEITPAEFDILKKMAEEDPQYKEILDLHRTLHEFRRNIPEVAPENFSQMRAEVMRSVRSRALQTRSNPLKEKIENMKNFFLRPEMAVAALTLIIGFLLGRITPAPSSTGSTLMSQIYSLATENKRLADVKNSPYLYSNVSFEEVNQQEIALSFDVTTRMNAIRPKNDPLVREVIAQTLLNPSNPGNELKAISYSSSMLDQKIKEALLFSAQNAPILAVRIKAMTGLMDYDADPDVKNVFLDIIMNEESVKMKLLALEYLEKSKISKDRLQKVVETLDRNKDAAIVYKAQKYLSREDILQ